MINFQLDYIDISQKYEPGELLGKNYVKSLNIKTDDFKKLYKEDLSIEMTLIEFNT